VEGVPAVEREGTGQANEKLNDPVLKNHYVISCREIIKKNFSPPGYIRKRVDKTALFSRSWELKENRIIFYQMLR
jgi:hypothetical protein